MITPPVSHTILFFFQFTLTAKLEAAYEATFTSMLRGLVCSAFGT